jgi:hypothetical protein
VPFCRECGKEVQEDWVTCPHCSESIVPPKTTGVQDSVIMGDVSINEGETKCVNCESIGVTKFACSICKEEAFCNVCKNEVTSNRPFTVEHESAEQLRGRLCSSCFIEKRDKVCDSICPHCKIYFDSATETFSNIPSDIFRRNTPQQFGFVPNPFHCLRCQFHSGMVNQFRYLMKNSQHHSKSATPETYRPLLEEALRDWDVSTNSVEQIP